MTEERKYEQKTWYPRIERMPLLYNVETGPNLSSDNRALLLDAEADEDKCMAGDQDSLETVRPRVALAPIGICTDDVWTQGGAALSSFLC